MRFFTSFLFNFLIFSSSPWAKKLLQFKQKALEKAKNFCSGFAPIQKRDFASIQKRDFASIQKRDFAAPIQKRDFAPIPNRDFAAPIPNSGDCSDFAQIPDSDFVPIPSKIADFF